MKVGICRRCLCVLLLCSLSLAWAKDFSLSASADVWTSIDECLTTLEEQLRTMQTLTQEQETQISELQNAYKEAYLLWQNSENSLLNLEKSMNRKTNVWRTVGIASLSATLVMVVVLGVTYGR